jgi:hypothetical protein
MITAKRPTLGEVVPSLPFSPPPFVELQDTAAEREIRRRNPPKG